MNITDSTSILNLDDSALPSIEDMSAIISHSIKEHMDAADKERGVVRSGNDEMQEERQRCEERMFIALCDASTRFDRGLTNDQFLAACKAWLA